MTNNIMHQTINTGKTWFDAAYEIGNRFQEQGEQILRTYINQAPWFDENAKKTMDAWLKSSKQGREAIKKAVDDNFSNMEKIFITTAGK